MCSVSAEKSPVLAAPPWAFCKWREEHSNWTSSQAGSLISPIWRRNERSERWSTQILKANFLYISLFFSNTDQNKASNIFAWIYRSFTKWNIRKAWIFWCGIFLQNIPSTNGNDPKTICKLTKDLTTYQIKIKYSKTFSQDPGIIVSSK